ncbi:MAG: TonB family protein [Deltaproteobacteria bacterium]|nr:TonB family protein [Deltaproteobacteria bacterium]
MISMAVHAGVAAAIVAIDGKPRERLATIIRMVEGRGRQATAEPLREAPPAADVHARPARARPVRRRPAAREPVPPPQTNEPVAPGTEGAKSGPGFFSGLVLGNEAGPGLAIGVSEDVQRRASAGVGDGRGGSASDEMGALEQGPCSEQTRPVVRSQRLTVEYPLEARAAGAAGRLVLELEVDAAGIVRRVRVLSPVHPAIDTAAIDAVRSWRFQPATACGKPVSSAYVVARTFELVD